VRDLHGPRCRRGRRLRPRVLRRVTSPARDGAIRPQSARLHLGCSAGSSERLRGKASPCRATGQASASRSGSVRTPRRTAARSAAARSPPGPARGGQVLLPFPTVDRFGMAHLYGRAGRLTAQTRRFSARAERGGGRVGAPPGTAVLQARGTKYLVRRMYTLHRFDRSTKGKQLKVGPVSMCQ
jgi:hypothetical protein